MPIADHPCKHLLKEPGSDRCRRCRWWDDYLRGWLTMGTAVAAMPLVQAKRVASDCRRRFSTFVKWAFQVVRPGTPLVWTWYLEALCDHVQWVLEEWRRAKRDRTETPADHRNLLVSVPPGSGKTLVISVLAPAWMWIDSPEWSCICLSVNPVVARDAAVECRALVNSPWYRQNFVIGVATGEGRGAEVADSSESGLPREQGVGPASGRAETFDDWAEAVSKHDAGRSTEMWSVSEDRNTMGKFVTTRGGFRASQGMTAQIIGARADCVAGETMVATEDGDVSIADLHAMKDPPRVWSQSPSGELELRRIVASRVIHRRPVLTLQTAEGRELVCTADHKVFSEGAYVKAVSLRGRSVTTLGSEDFIVSVERGGKVDVYDVQVEGNHNFFANGVLVHNCLLIDDPNDPSASSDEFTHTNAKFDTVIYHRVNNLAIAVRVVIQQRLDPTDLTGFILTRYAGGVTHLCLPLLHERDRTCKTGMPVNETNALWLAQDRAARAGTWRDPRQKDGQVLSVKRWPASEVKNLRSGLNFGAICQQDPLRAQGEHFEEKHWGFWVKSTSSPEERALWKTCRPLGCDQVRDAHVVPVEYGGRLDVKAVWVTDDPTSGSTSQSASELGLVIVAEWKIPKTGEQCWLVLHDCNPGRRSPAQQLDDLDKAIYKAAAITGHDRIRVLVEDKSSGKAHAEDIEKHVLAASFERIAVTCELYKAGSDASKEDRDVAVLDAPHSSGRVLLPDGATWNDALVRQFRRFPKKPNDKVDAIGQLVAHTKVSTKGWGDVFLRAVR